MKTASLLLSLTGAAAQTPAWVNPGATVATGNMCGLQYHHKPHAEPVDLTNTECSAWSDNSCCTFATADESLHKYDTQQGTSTLYGGGLGISGCGRVSPECQTFFIQESCLYECDVNAGRFRRHAGDAACADDGNTWQLSNFPLKV
jgi:folate receptor